MNKKGFTLVEMLAVIVILSLLLAIGIPSVMMIRGRMKENQLKTKLDLANKAALVWAKENENCFQANDDCIGAACGFECPELFFCNMGEGNTKVCRVMIEALVNDQILAGQANQALINPAPSGLADEEIGHYVVGIGYNMTNSSFVVSQSAGSISLTLYASWPSATQIRVSVGAIVGSGLQYRYSIGGRVAQDWSTASSYTFSALATGTAYSITAEVKNERDIIIGSKNTTIHTSRKVSWVEDYEYKDGCTNRVHEFRGNDIYEAIISGLPTCTKETRYQMQEYTRGHKSNIQTRTQTKTGGTQIQQRTATRSSINATCRNAACGCETHASCISTACPCATWKSCTNAACGCSQFNQCATAACGARTCTSASCGQTCGSWSNWSGYMRCQGISNCNATTCARTNSSTNTNQTECICSNRDCCCRTRTRTCNNATCTNSNICGWNTCRNAACGCQSPVTCRTSACGCEAYSSCVNPNCVCQTWRNCQHANCGMTCPSWPTIGAWTNVSSCTPASPTCAAGTQTLRECRTITACSESAWTPWTDVKSCTPTEAGCSLGTKTVRECRTDNSCGEWRVATEEPRMVISCKAIPRDDNCNTATPQTLYRTCVAETWYGLPTWTAVQVPKQKVY